MSSTGDDDRTGAGRVPVDLLLHLHRVDRGFLTHKGQHRRVDLSPARVGAPALALRSMEPSADCSAATPHGGRIVSSASFVFVFLESDTVAPFLRVEEPRAEISRAGRPGVLRRAGSVAV